MKMERWDCMKVIGLCGGSGSGKGVASTAFADLGVPVIDTDAIYHTMISEPSECTAELESYFGPSVINESGGLNRRALAEIVFATGAEDKLKMLNSIAHRHILGEARRLLSLYRERGCSAAVVDAPLLFESGFYAECDAVVAVIADRDTRIERIIARDAITREAAIKRIDAQRGEDFLREHADYVLENNGAIEELATSVKEVLMQILNNF